MQVQRRSWVLFAIAAWVAQAAAGQRLLEASAAGELPSQARQTLKQRCGERPDSGGNAFKGVVVGRCLER